MSNKHVFNDPDGLVLKALRGAVALNPGLRLHPPSKSVYAYARSNTRVALVSGGGAGHEPAHAGYTGRGMLAASVSGDIFASPSAAQALTCIQLATAAQETSDVLLIINNYTGDRLNFGLAAERARALGTGINVESVVVADDVALCDRPSLVGARGLAANILVCKVLGGAAEAGLDLQQLKCLGNAVVDNLASIGVGLAHCHVPGRKESERNEMLIKDGECELGLGLHNEPGVRCMRIEGVEKLVGTMLDQILTSAARRAKAQGEGGAESRQFVQLKGDEADEVVLYVNNLGGISLLEMSAIVDEAVSQLASLNIHPSRILLSSYMTSLNAPGFSLSILNISAIHRRLFIAADRPGAFPPIDVLAYIDAPTEATSWTGVSTYWPGPGDKRDRAGEEQETLELLSLFSNSTPERGHGALAADDGRSAISWETLGLEPKSIEHGLRGACVSVFLAEPDLTRFDTIVGDGDCGETFASGARAVLDALDKGDLDVKALLPAELTASLADLLMNSMGGTSGAIFGLYFTALSNALSSKARLHESDASQTLLAAPLAALEALSAHTPARPGDRTLVDALSPFCHSLASGEGLGDAVEKTKTGAQSTRGMQARLGRATYVGGGGADDSSELPPDPGAWGVAALLEGFVEGLKEYEEGRGIIMHGHVKI
ncbi:hypothetical protein M0805_004848 [Coniferiporia weirii]|nr:hypothetical protein M0805_004848 [Coniferiporia weirii]